MIVIRAELVNEGQRHEVRVGTDGRARPLPVGAREEGRGSAVSGGELLFAALATCYCNDVFREAAGRGITVRRVAVTVQGTFGGPGEPATDLSYEAEVEADADREAILDLMRHTDTVAEIQNTLRHGVGVRLTEAKAVPTARPA